MRLASSSVAVLLTAGLVAASEPLPENVVDQLGLRFSKPSASVKAGGTISFHNSDDVIHNIMTIDSNDATEDFGLQKPGEVIKASFPEAGIFQVRCSIHPKMKMSVSVTP
jgi:plastocyanin